MTNKRDSKGRFTEGNSGDPGRPKRQTEVAYLLAAMQNCSLEDWTAIIQKAVVDAKEGDNHARQFLARYLIGTPRSEAPNLVRALAIEAAEFDPVEDAMEGLKEERFFDTLSRMMKQNPDNADQFE